MNELTKYMRMLFDDPADGGADGAAGNSGAENKGTETKGAQDGGERLYTKAEMDAYADGIVGRKKAEWDKSHKTAVKDEAERLAAMNAQERAEHDRDEWKAKYEQLFAENARTTMQAQARKMIAEAGIPNASDELVARLVGADADETKATVSAFIAMYNESVQAGITNAAKKPSPKSGNTSPAVTKESIMAIKDQDERQAMMRKHHKLFGF